MGTQLLHAALLISVFGLLLLAYASECLEPPLSRASQITSAALGKNVRVEGNVSGIHRFDGGSILLTLRDSSGELDVYLPYDAAQGFSLNASEVEVIGAVELYAGRIEVVAEDPGDVRCL